MRSEQLVEAFMEHMNSLLFHQPAAEGQSVAGLYGDDEFGFDAKNGRVRLDGLGWIKCGVIPKNVRRRADWVAVITDENGPSVIVGQGNPYKQPPSETGLPSRNGSILAVPACMLDAVLADHDLDGEPTSFGLT